MKTKLKSISAAVLLATGLGAAVPASAETIQLGFILDRSGSIGQTDWNIIVNGLSSAVGSLIPVGGSDTYEISVVTFSSTATIDINSFTVNSLAQRSLLATQIAGLTTSYFGGGTDYAAAFRAMQTALTDAVGTPGFVQAGPTTKSYVNFATDGVPNSQTDAVIARNALIGAGVDNISIEGIGQFANPTFLKNSICYPGPCDDTNPYSFPTNGFYIGVDSAQDYVDAIGNKIKVVTNQVPEPASLALLGLGLLGLGFSRRKAA